MSKRRSLEELLEAAKLFHALQTESFVKLNELQQQLKSKNKKTFERRLGIIKKDFKSFDLVYKRNSGYKLIPCIANLQPKKIKEKKVLFEDTQQESLAHTITEMAKAIERKTEVTISSYKSVSRSKVEKYEVFPLKIYTGNDPYIIAINLKSKSLSRFNLKRGQNYNFHRTAVNKADIKKYEEKFKRIQYDDFGWIVNGKNPLKSVSLKLNNYSMSMIDHDFPELAKKRALIKKEKKQSGVNKQDEFEYTLEVNYCNIKAIGRLVTGMLQHIKVEGSNEVKEEFRKFVNMTVIDAIERNI